LSKNEIKLNLSNYVQYSVMDVFMQVLKNAILLINLAVQIEENKSDSGFC